VNTEQSLPETPFEQVQVFGFVHVPFPLLQNEDYFLDVNCIVYWCNNTIGTLGSSFFPKCELENGDS